MLFAAARDNPVLGLLVHKREPLAAVCGNAA